MHLRRRYERWYNVFEKWRYTAAEGARKHPMWAGTVTPANIWRMQEDIDMLCGEITSLKDKIKELEEMINEYSPRV